MNNVTFLDLLGLIQYKTGVRTVYVSEVPHPSFVDSFAD